MTIEFIKVNVFTNTKDGGNPLPVITDARGLDVTSMQAIATKFQCSETSFVFPPEDPAHTARVRIFNPEQELKFAGHPSIGTAFVLGRRGTVFGNPIRNPMFFEEIAGIVRAKLMKEKKKVIGAHIVAPERLCIGQEIDPEIIAACVSLRRDQIIVHKHQPRFASVGLEFALARIENLGVLDKACMNAAAYDEARERYPREKGRFAVLLYVLTGDGIDHIRTRMFNGKREDPATGSACAALAGFLTRIDPRRNLRTKIIIEQGIEMKHPSLLKLEVHKAKSIVKRVSVGGQCVLVEHGTVGCDGQLLTSYTL